MFTPSEISCSSSVRCAGGQFWRIQGSRFSKIMFVGCVVVCCGCVCMCVGHVDLCNSICSAVKHIVVHGVVHLYQSMCRSRLGGEAWRRSLWKVIPWDWMANKVGAVLVVGSTVLSNSLQPLIRHIGGCVSFGVGV